MRGWPTVASFYACLIGLFAAAACGGSDRGGTIGPKQCSSDADCSAATPACDMETGYCVQCLTHADCDGEALSYCSTDNTCAWECVSGDDCAPNGLCQSHACIPAPGCTSDADCQHAEQPICSDRGLCEWACRSPEDCGSGETCREHLCELDHSCRTDADCAGQAEPFCSTAGICEWSCRQDTDCALHAHCDETHDCVLDATCTGDGDCEDEPLPFCSDAGYCELECREHTHCALGELCGPGNTCVASTTCTDDAQCTGEPLPVCSSAGRCEWSCRTDSDCAAGSVCRLRDCVSLSGGCASDADCAGARPHCHVAGACVACLEHDDCPAGGYCADATCHSQPICSLPCPHGEYCAAGEQCLALPESCASDTDCPPGEHCYQRMCRPPCDRHENVSADDLHNPACWEAWGECDGWSHDGWCDPPRRSTRELGELCQGVDPVQPSFDDCMPGLVCAVFEQLEAKRCWEPCDPLQNLNGAAVGENPECGLGLCHDRYWTGVCDPRPLVQEENHPCGGFTLGAPDAFLCGPGFDCVRVGGPAVSGLCKPLCWPTASCCAPGQSCWERTYELGVCVEDPQPVRGLGEACHGRDLRDASWHDCLPELVCMDGVCVEQRQRTRQLDEACGGNDASRPEYDLCVEGLSCYAFGTLRLCRPTCDRSLAAPCAAGFYCALVSWEHGEYACIEERLPTQTEGQACLGDDPREPSWHDCAGEAPCRDHVCARPRTNTRQKGETCGLLNPDDPGYDLCAAGLACNRTYDRCLTPCQYDASPTGCEAGEACPMPWWPGEPTYCERPCNPDNGVVVGDCPAGQYCSTTWLGGTCRYLAAPESGDGQLGDPCWWDCDSSLGLACSGEVCRVACDPLAGVTGNIDCAGALEECVEDPYTFKGGVCVAPQSRDVGESCNDLDQRCLPGLVCTHAQTCAKPCAVDVATPVTNPACDPGSYCQPYYDASFANLEGYCVSLPLLELGALQLGDDCDPYYYSQHCDGSQGLYCREAGGQASCAKACDVRAGGPECGVDEACVEDYVDEYNPPTSFAGGACLPPAARGLDESCNGWSDRCVASLRCANFDFYGWAGICKQPCDPGAAVPGCPGGTECDWNLEACVEVREYVRTEGQSCWGDLPTEPDWDLCAPGLECRQTLGGRVCEGPRQVFEPCGEFVPCANGLWCIGHDGTESYCLPQCTPGAVPPTCSSGMVCATLDDGSGACMQQCDASLDCDLYGDVCMLFEGNSRGLCL